MTDWFEEKLKKYASLSGYQKPSIHTDSTKMDSNENFVINYEFQNEIISAAKKGSDIRQYPLNDAQQLTHAIAEYLNIDESMIGLGNGSDQILDLILTNFASKDTPVLLSRPTFTFFEDRCKLYSIPTIPIDFNDNMILEIKQFIAQASKAKILYLDTPNNPTGFQFERDELEKLIKQFSGLIIIDEAYSEFSKYSIIDLVNEHKNLIVVKTFSKAFGLAGLRLGYLIANKTFTDTFTRVIQYPYPLSTISIKAGIHALKKTDVVNASINIIQQERERVIQNLKQYDFFKVYNSQANFVLFDAGDSAKRIYDALMEQGISVRKFDLDSLANCLRVTIGTKEMNSKFLLAIRDLLE